MIRVGMLISGSMLAAALVFVPAGHVSAHSASASVSTASCTPGYSPCIKDKPSDVDCYGGSGNGPRYTRPGVVYRVTRGYDRYRLDADHDGKGCERNG